MDIYYHLNEFRYCRNPKRTVLAQKRNALPINVKIYPQVRAGCVFEKKWSITINQEKSIKTVTFHLSGSGENPLLNGLK